ncbi:DUF2383 domain-containing protein [Haloferula chungangensis]|uniref:DUF2383 domain-containing protein n=1 Tax=Haloferula chungangensis TaxID=1048331 RepID=A0ABW2L3B1_9BACT
MNTSTQNEECIEVCNSLLRGELSAVETYAQVIEKFDGDPKLGELQRIKDEHLTSVNRLIVNVTEMGGVPSTESGAWGTFAKTIQGAANLFGENSAISALLQGEEHGQSEYEDALKDDVVMMDCKTMIRSELLPRVNEHIVALKRLSN